MLNLPRSATRGVSTVLNALRVSAFVAARASSSLLPGMPHSATSSLRLPLDENPHRCYITRLAPSLRKYVVKSIEAEIMRIRYRYRKLILSGAITIPYREAAKLIGPDSAYRLYRSAKTKRPRSRGR